MWMKTNPSAKGGNGQISFDGHQVVISRRGFAARVSVGKVVLGNKSRLDLRVAGSTLCGGSSVESEEGRGKAFMSPCLIRWRET